MKSSQQSTLVYAALEERHLGDILPIEAEAYPEAWTEGMFRDEMRSPRSYFRVVYAGETLIGYCGFWLILDEAHITSVTVAQAFRGNGYGREQLVHLLETARGQGAVLATLEVRESNIPAKTLYEGLGFRRVGVRKGYYSKTNEDALVMLKDLD